MKSLKISYKNLMRSKRRALLTISLISMGVIFVLLFAAFSGSFKSYMIGQITDSMLGHIQIHKKGYVASLDNMPLDKNLPPQATEKIVSIIETLPMVQSYSLRLKFAALISNYENSTNVRLNGIDPDKEHETLPLLQGRVTSGTAKIKEGEIIIPDIISKGMGLKVGDSIVLVATNKTGSMNARSYKIAGVLGIISGPGGRDGYVHINDARKLLRIKGNEVNEIVIRLKELDTLPKVYKRLHKELIEEMEKPKLELHTWKQLTPFTSIANMIDLMSLSIKVILISIVLISILNVMIMSVYERIKEIGTMTAIGTAPSFIAATFIFEGLLLGLTGGLIGLIVSLGVVYGVGDITFAFGRQDEILLTPVLPLSEMGLILVLVLFIAAVASLYPAMKAAKMNPVDALRS